MSDDPAELASEANTVTVKLKDGRKLSRQAKTFIGTPSMPATQKDVHEKFSILTRHCPRDKTQEIYERLQNLEKELDFDWLYV